MSMFTFHYNQSGDARKLFVKAVSEVLETKPRYLGMPSMAYEIGFATVTKEGNIELNSRTGSEQVENLVDRLAERGYEPDPAEMPHRSAEDELQNAGQSEEEAQTFEALSENTVSVENGASLTVSVPRGLFRDPALENLRRLLVVKHDLICKALEIESTAIEVSGEAVSFPWWNRPLEPEQVHVCSQFIDRLCKFAIASKRVTANIKPSRNERFDMRCWLIRLGCSGPEYKALRAAFMKNLVGDAAWKNGRPMTKSEASTEEAAEDAE